MANWYYIDANGQKQGPIRGRDLSALAKNGIVTPETLIETEQGKQAKAKKVKGLEFSKPSPIAMDSLPVSSVVQHHTAIPTPPVPPVLQPMPVAVPMSVPPPQNPPSRATSHTTLLVISCVAITLLVGILLWAGMSLFGVKSNPQIAKNPAAAVKPAVIIEDMPPDDGAEFVKNYGSLFRGDLELLYFDSYRGVAETENRRCNVFIKGYDIVDTVSSICVLQEGCESVMNHIATEWGQAIKFGNDNAEVRIQPNFDQTLSIMLGQFRKDKLYSNIDKCMQILQTDIKELDKQKYENTLKLYAILSQYHEAIQNPTGSYNDYVASQKSYKSEFTKILSLAKLEW